MDNPIIFILFGLGIILVFVGIAISQLFPTRWIWIAVASFILGGFMVGLYPRQASESLSSRLIIGLIISISLNLILIPSGLLTKYYQKKARELREKLNQKDK